MPSRVWWHTPIIPAIGKPRQDALSLEPAWLTELVQGSLSYITENRRHLWAIIWVAGSLLSVAVGVLFSFFSLCWRWAPGPRVYPEQALPLNFTPSLSACSSHGLTSFRALFSSKADRLLVDRRAQCVRCYCHIWNHCKTQSACRLLGLETVLIPFTSDFLGNLVMRKCFMLRLEERVVSAPQLESNCWCLPSFPSLCSASEVDFRLFIPNGAPGRC